MRGLHLSTSVISGRAALIKCDFKFFLFLNQYWYFRKYIFMVFVTSEDYMQFFQRTFQISKHCVCVTLNVSLLSFPGLFFLIQQFISWNFSCPKYFLWSNLELYPLSRRNFSKSFSTVTTRYYWSSWDIM